MTEGVSLAALVLTKNEEANLAACLASIPASADTIVVDSQSTDRTIEIAHAKGAEVVQFCWDRAYPKKKEWATDLAAERGYTWVLLLDADERLSEGLRAETLGIVSRDAEPGDAYGAFLRYAFAGKLLRRGFRPWKIILFQPGSARWPRPDDLHIERMWEVEGHYQVEVPGKVRSFRSQLHHEDEDDLFSLIARHNRYSDWEAGLSSTGGISRIGRGTGLRGSVRRIWQGLPCKGAIAFLHSYVIKRGFTDGSAGFDYAVFRLFYYWQIQAKKREAARRGRR